MQISPIPLPPASTAVAQPQALPNTLPQVLTQAVAPIGKQAIAPTTKDERGQKARTRREKDGKQSQDGGKSRGGNVNMSV